MSDTSTNNNDSESGSHCSIVGLVGIIVQLSLGVLSFSVLIIKRFCENPKRPWKIWRFDTCKQVMSQLLAHFINLTISLALTSQDPDSDNCLWYFITNIFDNTVGVFICVITLRLLQKLFFKKKKYFLISGNYYEIKQAHRQQMDLQHNQVQQNLELSPPIISIDYKSWLLQLVIWNSIVIIAKVLLFVLEFLLQNVLDKASNFLLGWIQKYPNLELVVVIIIVPVIMNGFAFWVQDNFLKKRQIPHDSISDEKPHVQIQLHEMSDMKQYSKQNQMQKKQSIDQQTQQQKKGEGNSQNKQQQN